MKKLLMLILSLAMATAALTSCGLFEIADESSSPSASSIETPIEKTYKVTFKQMGEEDVVKEVKEGESLAGNDIPAPKAKTGYTVTWKAADLEKLTDINANVVVEAVLEANTYTITYDAQGGSCPSTQKVVYDSDVVLATPELEGNKFICWLDADGKTVSNGKWTVASNVTLTAKWEEIKPETVTITFQTGAGEFIASKTIEKGTALSKTDIPAYPTDAGYEYSWSVNDFSNITENMTVTLNAVAKTFIIEYNPNGGTITAGDDTQSVTYGAAYTLAYPTAEKAGFDLEGWEYRDGTLPSGNWNIPNHITLYAVWMEKAPEMITVTFKNAAGDVIGTETLEKGTTLTSVPALPTQEGYTFKWDKATDVAFDENTVITAVPTAIQYTITYNPNDGQITAGNATQKVTYGAPYTLEYPTASREGYNFMAWKLDGNELPVGNWNIASDVTMVATWEKINYYTVTFVQAGQAPKEFKNIKEGTAFTNIPDVVEKDGYTIEWNETELAKLASVTDNVIVNAVETANKYKVTFKDAKNVVTQEVEVTYDAAYDLTPASAPTGYHFDYFTKDGEKFAASNTEWKIANDVELTVVWAGNTYTVKLNANEGTCSAATIDVIYGESYTLPTPTKEGYIFEGWYQDSTKVELTGTWSLTGASIELKAKWRNEEWTKNY